MNQESADGAQELLLVPGNPEATLVRLEQFSRDQADTWTQLAIVLTEFPQSQTLQHFVMDNRRQVQVPLLHAVFQRIEADVSQMLHVEMGKLSTLSAGENLIRRAKKFVFGSAKSVTEYRIEGEVMYLHALVAIAKNFLAVCAQMRARMFRPETKEAVSNILVDFQTLYQLDTAMTNDGSSTLRNHLNALQKSLETLLQTTPHQQDILARGAIEKSKNAFRRRMEEMQLLLKSVKDEEQFQELREKYMTLVGTLKEKMAFLEQDIAEDSRHLSSTYSSITLQQLDAAIREVEGYFHAALQTPQGHQEQSLSEGKSAPVLQEVVEEYAELSLKERSALGEELDATYIGPMTSENSFIGRAVWDGYDEMGHREKSSGYVSREGKIFYRVLHTGLLPEDFFHERAVVPTGSGKFQMMNSEGVLLGKEYAAFLPPRKGIPLRVAYAQEVLFQNPRQSIEVSVFLTKEGEELNRIPGRITELRPWGEGYLIKLDEAWYRLDSQRVILDAETETIRTLEVLEKEGKTLYLVNNERLIDTEGREQQLPVTSVRKVLTLCSGGIVILYDQIPGHMHQGICIFDPFRGTFSVLKDVPYGIMRVSVAHDTVELTSKETAPGIIHMTLSLQKPGENKETVWEYIIDGVTMTPLSCEMEKFSTSFHILYGTTDIPVFFSKNRKDYVYEALPHGPAGDLIRAFLQEKRIKAENVRYARCFLEVNAIIYVYRTWRTEEMLIYDEGESRSLYLNKLLGYELEKVGYIHREWIQAPKDANFDYQLLDTGKERLELIGYAPSIFFGYSTNLRKAKHLKDDLFFVHSAKDDRTMIVALAYGPRALFFYHWCGKATDAEVVEDGCIRLSGPDMPDEYIDEKGNRLFGCAYD